MIEASAVSALVAGADFADDGAALKSRELILMLLAETAQPFSRQQFTPGHITATGLVLAPGCSRLLLVHHRRLDRWLLPGGHVEMEDAAIGQTARREVVEETGAVLLPAESAVLVSLDVHGIPPKRGEPYHLHHDLVFRFQAVEEALQVSAESRAVRWCSPAEFDFYQVPDNVRRAWARVSDSDSRTLVEGPASGRPTP
jgi:8-oxo-dGTP pyrophosphatase MutT (NUDIX family)